MILTQLDVSDIRFQMRTFTKATPIPARISQNTNVAVETGWGPNSRLRAT